MDAGQGNDELRLVINGEMLPTEERWVYHDYADGEFVVEGVIADHGGSYEATKVYTLNICVIDRYGEGDPPLSIRVTSPYVRGAMVTRAAGTTISGSGRSSDPWIIRSGTSASFEATFVCVGFSLPGTARRPLPYP